MAAALLTAVMASLAGIGGAIYLGLTAGTGEMLSRHITIGIFSTMVNLLAHSMMMFYFLGKGKAVREAAESARCQPAQGAPPPTVSRHESECATLGTSIIRRQVPRETN